MDRKLTGVVRDVSGPRSDSEQKGHLLLGSAVADFVKRKLTDGPFATHDGFWVDHVQRLHDVERSIVVARFVDMVELALKSFENLCRKLML